MRCRMSHIGLLGKRDENAETLQWTARERLGWHVDAGGPPPLSFCVRHMSNHPPARLSPSMQRVPLLLGVSGGCWLFSLRVAAFESAGSAVV